MPLSLWPASTAWQRGHLCLHSPVPSASTSQRQQPHTSHFSEPPACGRRGRACRQVPRAGPGEYDVLPPRRRPQPVSRVGEDGVEEYDLEDLENQYFETAEEAQQALERRQEEIDRRRAERASENPEDDEEDEAEVFDGTYAIDPEGRRRGFGPNADGLPSDHMLLDRAPLPEPANIQQTLARSFHCAGLGVQNGTTNEIRVLPAHAGQGRYFVYVQTPEPLGLQFLGATAEELSPGSAAETSETRNEFEEQAAIKASDFPILDSEPSFNPRPDVAPMRRGEFLAYLEAQAAGYAGTFDEWEFDQYPRLQPPGFGASDLDEEVMIRLPQRSEAIVPAMLEYAHAAPQGYTYLAKGELRVNCVEGLLAALEACGVNNCRIELRGNEVPFMDGSARPFVRLIHMAGVCVAPARPGEEALNERLTESFLENKDVGLLSATVEASQAEQSSGAEDPDAEASQTEKSSNIEDPDAEKPTERLALSSDQELTVREGQAFISFIPQPDQLFTAGLDYSDEAPVIGRQWHTWSLANDPHFYFEISPARAFHTSQRALQLRKEGHLRGAGVGTHMVAIGSRWYDPRQARFFIDQHEQARNRILTLVGNVALLNDRGNGAVPYGHIVSYQADHDLQLRFLRQLQEQLAWVSLSQSEAALQEELATSS